ncbi:MAG TPA: primosomal replication protein PriB/PriC domain protein [Mizugakiibacter sp.]
MSTATDMLQKYHDAEAAILGGQEVQWGDRRLKLADLAEVRAGRAEWERKVAAEQRAAAGDRSRAGYAVADFSGCS